MKKILILLFVLAISLFASIGQISAVKGQAKLLRGNKSLDVVRGLSLEKKDTITTQKGTKIQMIFKDGTTISIGSKSKFNIAEYVFDEATPKASKTDFRFLKGAFKSITGRIGKIAPEKFKLRTRNASIGIRGTTVVGDQTKVACTYGKITVTAKGVTVEVPAGMVTSTPKGAPPTPPVAYKAGSIGIDKGKSDKKDDGADKPAKIKKSTKAKVKGSGDDPVLGGTPPVVDGTPEVDAPKVDTSGIDSAVSTVTDNAANDLASSSSYTVNLSGYSLSGVGGSLFVPLNGGFFTSTAQTGTVSGSTRPAVGAYTGHSKVSSSLGSSEYASLTYTTTTDVEADNTAEFFVFRTTADIAGQHAIDAAIAYNDLKYLGTAPVVSNLISNSVYQYLAFDHLEFEHNLITGKYISKFDNALDKPKIFLNTRTNSLHVSDYNSFNAFKLNADGTMTGKTIYQDNGNYVVSDDTGSLYGTNLQGIGIHQVGNEYVNYDGTGTQTSVAIHEEVGVAFLNSRSSISNTGSVTFSGFSNDTENNYGTVSNMLINRDSGAISGTNFTAANSIYNVNFGGTVDALSSYYINDDIFGVMMSGGTFGPATYTDNSGWLIAIPDVVDSGIGNAAILSWNNDDESSWGYWGGAFTYTTQNDSIISPLSTWVAGTPTPATLLNILFAGSNIATFSGHLIGSANHGSDQILLDANNVFNMSIDFGGGTGNMSGTAAFNTASGQNWSATFGGDATSSGFSATNFTALSGETVTSGEVSGSYFGSGLKSVGGHFKFRKVSSFAQGVFKADKTN